MAVPIIEHMVDTRARDRSELNKNQDTAAYMLHHIFACHVGRGLFDLNANQTSKKSGYIPLQVDRPGVLYMDATK